MEANTLFEFKNGAGGKNWGHSLTRFFTWLDFFIFVLFWVVAFLLIQPMQASERETSYEGTFQ